MGFSGLLGTTLIAIRFPKVSMVFSSSLYHQALYIFLTIIFVVNLKVKKRAKKRLATKHTQSVILQAECDFHTHECNFDTLECDYDMLKFASYTQNVISTSTSLISTRRV
jgi:hypothetical protein